MEVKEKEKADIFPILGVQIKSPAIKLFHFLSLQQSPHFDDFEWLTVPS